MRRAALKFVEVLRRRVRPVRGAAGVALSKRRLPLVLLLVLGASQFASAQTDVYTIRGNATAGSNNIWSVDPTTGAEQVVYTGYPGGNAATLAQRPSDGMIFYAINGTNGAVYRFNPATPGVAPALIGNLGPTLGGANVSGGFRMAFNGNTLYYMVGNAGTDANTVYTVDQNNGRAAPLATVTNTLNGGDIAFFGNTLYIIDQDRRVCSYANLPANGAAGNCGTVNIPNANSIGITFNAAGQMLLQTVNPSNLYRVTIPGLAVTSIAGLSGGNTATGDMAGAANIPAPDLSISKTNNVTSVYRGGPVSYTVIVTNTTTYSVTGTVSDAVPAAITGVTWNCVASAGSVCTTASGAGNNINTSARLAANDGTATYTISGTVSATATGTLANTATVQPPAWFTDPTPGNNTATDSDPVNLNANLGITKTDGLTSVNPGSAVTYTVVVSNAGPDASNNSVVTDTVPAAITGVAWTCGSPTGGAACGAANGTGNNISTTANLPSGGSVTYTITGTLSTTATGVLTNTARVVVPASGVYDPTDPTRTGAGNNSATDTTTVNPVSDVRIAKTHSGNFTVGVNGAYMLTASNAGNGPTSGTITVTDNLPAGLTVAAPLPNGTGWDCSTTVLGSSTVTCTSTTIINAASTSLNPITLNVAVAPAAFAASPVTNVANISGGGEPAFNNGNNSASDVTTINGAPDLTITKTHTGNFTRGSTGGYTIVVTNSGTATTSGLITVTDNLPAGLTVAAPLPSGTGWDCSTTVVGGTTATCTRSTTRAAGLSFPTISLNVNVAQTAAASVTNTASVSGGGENNSGNNTANDPTTVVSRSDLSLTKVVTSPGSGVGSNATFTLTLTNAGPTDATNVAVRDQLPASLSYFSSSPAGAYNSATGIWTIPTLASGASTTLQLVARINVVGALTNTAQVSASDQPDPDSTPNNNNASEDDQASATLNVTPPVVGLCKTFPGQTCDPAPSLPPQPPGAEITYVINFTNTGGSPAQNLIILDRIPAETDFKVGSAVLNLGTTGIAPATPQIQYTNVWGAGGTPNPPDPNDAVAWSYAPSGAHDPQVKFIRLRLNADVPPNTTGSITFTVRIK